MGMVLALRTTSDANIRTVLADPTLIWKVIAPDDPEIYEEARASKMPGFLQRFFGGKSENESEGQEVTLPQVNGEGAEIDLDKSWHGIHYLLTGTAWEGEPPMNFIVSGGIEIGDVDTGYGPARAIDSVSVAAITEALSGVDTELLRTRFRPDEMQKLDIYPSIWDRDPNQDDTLGYCLEFYEELKRFLKTASENNLGVVLYLC